MDNDATPDQKWRLLFLLMRSVSAVQKNRAVINEMLFFTEDSDMRKIWGVLDAYELKYEAVPYFGIYKNELYENIKDQIDSPDFSDIESLFQVIRDALKLENPLLSEVNYWSDWLHDKYVEWAKEAAAEASRDGDFERIQGIIKKAQAARVSDAELETNPFVDNNPDLFLSDVTREGIGVPLIDGMCGGGLLAGEDLLISMPTGTGKTTLGIQAIDCCVSNKKHVLYHSVEQNLENPSGDLALRMYILCTGSNRGVWARHGTAGEVFKHYPEYKEKWDKNREKWAKYMHFYDGWARSGINLRSLYDLFAPLYRLKERGILVEYMILDWWGDIVSKMASSNNVSPADQMDWGKRWSQEFNGLMQQAIRDGIPVRALVLHQVSGAAAERSLGSPIPIQSMAGDKELPNRFAYAVATTKLDPKTGIFTANREKARAGEQGVEYFKMWGDRCIIVRPTQDEIESVSSSRRSRDGSGKRKTYSRI